MPVFEFKSPDGKTYEVNGPDGSTKEQAFAHLQTQIGATPPAPKQETSQALGFYQGLTKPLDNAARGLEYGLNKLGVPTDAINKFAGLPSSAEVAQSHQGYISDQAAKGVTPGGIGKFAGEVAGTLPTALASTNPIVAGGMAGALLSDKSDPLGVAKDVGIGVAGGKIGDSLVKGVANVVSPTINKYAQQLLGEGVRLTPGQIMGGALHEFEDKLSSIPILGDVISNARIRGLQDFNEAAINRVLDPIGQKLPAGMSGREAIDAAHTAVSDNYNRILSQATFKADPTLTQNVGNLTTLAQNIPEYGNKPLKDFIATNISPRISANGTMSGQSFKEVEEMLGKEAKLYASGGPNDRKLADAFSQLRQEFRDGLARSNPKLAPQLQDTNEAFANLVRVEGAAAARGGGKGVDPGVFSPAQLASSVRSSDSSARKNAVARGGALMQDLSDAGASVLPAQVPDSGTAGRFLAAALAGGGATHMVAPGAAIPALGAMGLYTKPGIKLAQTLLTSRPAQAKAIAQLLRNNSQVGGQAGAIGATGLAAQLMNGANQ